ncbi:MAG: ATP-grasp domain-containing protein, partial [Burkholderiaceae bacterium]|nr:ATP-grasp domain-containing protein [Burkholderiaceae bacterium]
LSESMEALGNKAKAKTLATKAGVPCVPGSTGPVKDQDEAIKLARQIGYPVLIKAVAGGGGRGMRIAHNDASLVSGLIQAQREAEAAFGNGECIIEAFIQRARHIEIQIIGDKHGHVISLGERDCSTQRRHQKLVEESPSPVITAEIRKSMGADAVKLAKAAGYYNAGTVEFIYDLDRKAYYFLEMNTRIQVEHPVTEMVTGIDLVAEQLRVAAGLPLSFSQAELAQNGHAIECRINAEDPDRNFLPRPGVVARWNPPQGAGIRCDSHCHDGYTVTPYYDSLLGKLIVHAPTRAQAIDRMIGALQDLHVEGPASTAPFHRAVLAHEDFAAGRVTTRWVEDTFIPQRKAQAKTNPTQDQEKP